MPNSVSQLSTGIKSLLMMDAVGWLIWTTTSLDFWGQTCLPSSSNLTTFHLIVLPEGLLLSFTTFTWSAVTDVTIFVLGVNPSKKKIMMLSIPRDTKVDIEGKSRKINEILPRYGEPTLRMLLEDLLKIRISRRIEVGFESFIAVVDAIGGVDINIEKPMHYDDNWGNLHIHFNPGMNHLNGQDALRYVRFRKDAMADLGRIKRQQDFVKAVIKKLFSPAIIVKLPSIIETAFKYIKTDFTLQEIMTLAKGFDTFDVKFSTLSLPGEARYIDKISYFIPNLDETIAIGNNYFSDLAIIEIEKDCDLGKIIPKQGKTNRKNK